MQWWVSKKMPTADLKQLKDRIEALNQHHQIQILKIMTQCNVGMTENKNGSFINLTNVDDAVISKIKEYLSYVDEQESQLNEVENQKTELTKQFFKSWSFGFWQCITSYAYRLYDLRFLDCILLRLWHFFRLLPRLPPLALFSPNNRSILLANSLSDSLSFLLSNARVMALPELSKIRSLPMCSVPHADSDSYVIMHLL